MLDIIWGDITWADFIVHNLLKFQNPVVTRFKQIRGKCWEVASNKTPSYNTLGSSTEWMYEVMNSAKADWNCSMKTVIL